MDTLAAKNFRVPTHLECSFPVKHHPRQEALVKLSRSWLMSRFSSPALERQLKIRYDLLTCMFWPNGSSEARSLPLVKLMYWFFFLDDLVDNPSVMGKDLEGARGFLFRLMEEMFGKEGADAAGLISGGGETSHCGSFAKEEPQQLLMDLSNEWLGEMRAQGMPAKQQKRLAASLGEYFQGILAFVEFREQEKLPDLEEYILLRRQDAAIAVCLVLCEFDLDIELDDDTLAHPLVRAFHDAVADQSCWINDVLSLKAEFAEGDHISLVAVLHHRNSNKNKSSAPVDFNEAVSQACAMIKARDQDCTRLALEIVAWKPGLQPYVDSTRCIISAVWEWTRTELNRYSVVNADQHHGADLQPLSFPAQV